MKRDYNEFAGKKILLLGAHALMLHLIRKAREMGIYTIVTDNVEDAPAKQEADEAYDISVLDVEALIALAKEKQVDGVFTGYVDITLAPCRKVCEALGLPFYATLEQLEQTMNKVNFKENCRKHGIRVVDDIPQELLDGVYEKITYPVIIKPADSYGGKGISVCHRKEEMTAAMEKAMEVSTCKQIVVEEFIDAKDAFLYLTIQNGHLSLSAMADRLMNNEQYGCATQPVGYFFPSKHINVYFEKVHDKLQRMMDDLGIRDGSFLMQGFIVEGDIVFFEMGLRLSGGAGYLQIAKQNEIDQLEMHLRYALTGKFDGWDLKTYDNPRFAKPACVMVVLLNDGEISRIDGVETVLAHPNVFDMVRMKKVGDRLDARGTLNQVFARIFMTAENGEELRETITFVKKNLSVLDVDGRNMIMDSFNEKEVYGN